MAWKDEAEAKKKKIDETIPEVWRIQANLTDISAMSVPKDSGLLTTDELLITETSATDLVKKLAGGELSSVAVTTAFCKRAAIAHQLVRSPKRFVLNG